MWNQSPTQCKPRRPPPLTTDGHKKFEGLLFLVDNVGFKGLSLRGRLLGPFDTDGVTSLVNPVTIWRHSFRFCRIRSFEPSHRNPNLSRLMDNWVHSLNYLNYRISELKKERFYPYCLGLKVRPTSDLYYRHILWTTYGRYSSRLPSIVMTLVLLLQIIRFPQN